jgi:hypothetical protein
MTPLIAAEPVAALLAEQSAEPARLLCEQSVEPAPEPPAGPPPQLCRHCELPLLQVSVPDGPQPVRLHAESLQSRCAPPLRTTAFPAPMSLVDGVWMTERMARALRGLPTEPLQVPADLIGARLLLTMSSSRGARRDVAAAG